MILKNLTLLSTGTCIVVQNHNMACKMRRSAACFLSNWALSRKSLRKFGKHSMISPPWKLVRFSTVLYSNAVILLGILWLVLRVENQGNKVFFPEFNQLLRLRLEYEAVLYDTSRHSRSNDSAHGNEVRQVLWPALIDTATEKCLLKAVVLTN